MEEKGNSILHQGNQNEAFPLGNVDEMLILVCCYSSGLVPALWLKAVAQRYPVVAACCGAGTGLRARHTCSERQDAAELI